MKPVPLTADLIESFSGIFLSPRYDQPRPTAAFHREAWKLYASPVPAAMVIAPRDHAKSTALTFDYVLAEALFRNSDYIIVIGCTEEMAQEQMSNISEELHENDDLRGEFGPFTFETDAKTEIIVKHSDGHRFRILARGAEQRIRGRLWNGKRPNLLVCDDLEDDEQVENKDRRDKFRHWFFRAAKQALGKGGRIRVHGTILHEDSLLNRLRRNSEWEHLFYKAHQSFDDFSNILWPERWSEKDLRAKQRELVADGDAAGYSQEMLNDPLDNSEAFLKKADFLEMTEQDYEVDKLVIAAADFAVSKADLANRTSFDVGGLDSRDLLHWLDCRVGRWDTVEWIDEMFSIQKRWSPEVFYVEDGVIWKSVWPMIRQEMQRRRVYINFQPVLPVKDKATRGRSLQKRMRAGATRWDKEAEWYPGKEQEMLRFTGRAAATLDDQFDSAALLARGADDHTFVEDEDFDTEEMSFIKAQKPGNNGRSAVTGY